MYSATSSLILTGGEAPAGTQRLVCEVHLPADCQLRDTPGSSAYKRCMRWPSSRPVRGGSTKAALYLIAARRLCRSSLTLSMLLPATNCSPTPDSLPRPAAHTSDTAPWPSPHASSNLAPSRHAKVRILFAATISSSLESATARACCECSRAGVSILLRILRYRSGVDNAGDGERGSRNGMRARMRAG